MANDISKLGELHYRESSGGLTSDVRSAPLAA